MAESLKIVGVMGSGDAPVSDDAHVVALGRMIAGLGCHLLTGAGEGVMTAASRGFVEVEDRAGLCIGIVPARSETDWRRPGGYPNAYVELPINTHLGRGGDPDTPLTRNHINILSADALVFCLGNDGTYSELILADRYEKPRILYLPGGGTIGKKSASELAHLGEATEDLGAVQRFLEGVIG